MENQRFDTPHSAEKPAPEMPELPIKPVMAVFGGSFDPVHNGHLYIAGSILRLELADEILFVPAKQPPHKELHTISPGPDRLAMLEAATLPHAKLGVSDIELTREDGPSYTIDTMDMLTRVFTDYELCFIMGIDSLLDLHSWYRAGELVNRFRFLIYPRNGIRDPSHAELNPHFGPRNARKLLNSIVDLPEHPVSATAVRREAQRQASLAGLVSDGVAAYITHNKLYRQEPPVEPSA